LLVFDAWAEAQAYLRSNSNDNSRSLRDDKQKNRRQQVHATTTAVPAMRKKRTRNGKSKLQPIVELF